MNRLTSVAPVDRCHLGLTATPIPRRLGRAAGLAAGGMDAPFPAGSSADWDARASCLAAVRRPARGRCTPARRSRRRSPAAVPRGTWSAGPGSRARPIPAESGRDETSRTGRDRAEPSLARPSGAEGIQVEASLCPRRGPGSGRSAERAAPVVSVDRTGPDRTGRAGSRELRLGRCSQRSGGRRRAGRSLLPTVTRWSLP